MSAIGVENVLNTDDQTHYRFFGTFAADVCIVLFFLAAVIGAYFLWSGLYNGWLDWKGNIDAERYRRMWEVDYEDTDSQRHLPSSPTIAQPPIMLHDLNFSRHDSDYFNLHGTQLRSGSNDNPDAITPAPSHSTHRTSTTPNNAAEIAEEGSTTDTDSTIDAQINFFRARLQRLVRGVSHTTIPRGHLVREGRDLEDDGPPAVPTARQRSIVARYGPASLKVMRVPAMERERGGEV